MPKDASRDTEAGPERTCIVTRRKAPPEAMIRFVLSPDMAVIPDIRRKLPGRGVWVDADEATVAKAVRTQAFARGFKAKVKDSPLLADEVRRLLEQDSLQSLAMANKAGLVSTGFAKVEAALAAGGVAVTLHASDAGEDGVRKLDGTARRESAGAIPPSCVRIFTSQQLDLALGRTNVIHAALAEGPASEAFLTRCRRLIRYGTAQAGDGAAHREADADSASA